MQWWRPEYHPPKLDVAPERPKQTVREMFCRLESAKCPTGNSSSVETHRGLVLGNQGQTSQTSTGTCSRVHVLGCRSEGGRVLLLRPLLRRQYLWRSHSQLGLSHQRCAEGRSIHCSPRHQTRGPGLVPVR